MLLMRLVCVLDDGTPTVLDVLGGGTPSMLHAGTSRGMAASGANVLDSSEDFKNSSHRQLKYQAVTGNFEGGKAVVPLAGTKGGDHW